jgi:hypothetical protein
MRQHMKSWLRHAMLLQGIAVILLQLVLSSVALAQAGQQAFQMISVNSPLSFSVVIIDQQNGSVTQCTGLFNTTIQQPVGSCSKIATVTPPAANTNLITAVEDMFVFILNPGTRTLYRCPVTINSQTANPTGNCAVAMANVP